MLQYVPKSAVGVYCPAVSACCLLPFLLSHIFKQRIQNASTCQTCCTIPSFTDIVTPLPRYLRRLPLLLYKYIYIKWVCFTAARKTTLFPWKNYRLKPSYVHYAIEIHLSPPYCEIDDAVTSILVGHYWQPCSSEIFIVSTNLKVWLHSLIH